MTRSTSSRRRGACAALGAALALAGAASASAAPERADTVFVKLDPSASPFAKAAVGGVLGAASWRSLPGGWRVFELKRPVTLASAKALLRSTDADRGVALDSTLRPALAPVDPLFTNGSQYAPRITHAVEAWDIPQIAPAAVVAVVDTGVDTGHQDLVNALWANPAVGTDPLPGLHGWNFSNAGSTSTLFTGFYEDAHGTHVAGIIAAEGNNVGVAGMAGVGLRAQIMNAKFMAGGTPTNESFGTASDAIRALNYASARHARVINASWGGPAAATPQALCDTVNSVAQNSLVVVAAGNASTNTDLVPDSPGNCASDGVITVAATGADDSLSDFSNFGPGSIDMGAPGDAIMSTLPLNGYGEMSGTSMAAPQVSAVAALMLGQDAFLTPSQLREGLMGCGDPVASLIGKTVSGRRLNALNSVDQARSLTTATDGSAPCPFAILSPADGAVSTPLPVFGWQRATDLRAGVSSYRVLVDGQSVARTDAATFTAAPATALSQGTHTWTVQAVDGAGNVRDASTTRTLIVDSGPPEPFSLLAPAAGLATRSRVPTLGWSATTDTGVGLIGYQLVVDGTTGGLLAPTVLASAPSAPLPDGQHTWQVRAYDALNQIRDSEVRGFVVDTVAPRPFLLRGAIDGALVGSRRPSLLWTRPADAGGGVTFTVMIDGKARAKGVAKTSWRSPRPLRAGRHSWRVRATDAAGNVRTSATGVFVVRR